MSGSPPITRLRSYPVRQRIITALDVSGTRPALDLAQQLGPTGQFVKVGLELFSAAGPDVVHQLQAIGKEVFLDLKYHDIPNTVAGAARIAADLGVAMVTIHTVAGRRALAAAAEALAQASNQAKRPALLAVTVLTSLNQEDLDEVAPGTDSLPERIVRLAQMACSSGCDGLVCAATDLPGLRRELGDEPLVVTPGIRPANAASDDQRRVATAATAVSAGADFLVIGRPITRAPDPAAALEQISQEIPV